MLLAGIALATGVVTLPIDDPLRVAEDAAVLDQLSGGRVQLGLATGGTPSSFAAFGRESDRRREIFAEHLEVLLDALGGRGIRGTDSRIYPAAGDLDQRIWQATFSADGGRRAGERGDGLLLSRTQPRPADAPDAPLHDLQLPIIEAYRDALPEGAPVRVLASRTALVVDPENRTRALELADHRAELEFQQLQDLLGRIGLGGDLGRGNRGWNLRRWLIGAAGVVGGTSTALLNLAALHGLPSARLVVPGLEHLEDELGADQRALLDAYLPRAAEVGQWRGLQS